MGNVSITIDELVVESYEVYAGGAPFNFAYTISKSNVDESKMFAVGADKESADITFSVYIPIESSDIVFNSTTAGARYDSTAGILYVQRERSYTVAASMKKSYASAANATISGYSLASTADATIDVATGIVSVKNTASIGGIITIRATSADGTSATKDVYIETVYATAINSVMVYRSNGDVFNPSVDYVLPSEVLTFAVTFNPFNPTLKSITLSSAHNNGSYITRPFLR